MISPERFNAIFVLSEVLSSNQITYFTRKWKNKKKKKKKMKKS